MAAIGDERLFELLEDDGPALARGDGEAFDRGTAAEVVERAGWAKIEVVLADEREQGGPAGAAGTAAAGRLALNLGHSVGMPSRRPAAMASCSTARPWRSGYGPPVPIGLELGVTPPARAARIVALLDRLDLGRERLPYDPATVRGHLGTDKKHAGGRLRWILPTTDGVAVRTDVPDPVVDAAIASVLREPHRRRRPRWRPAR